MARAAIGIDIGGTHIRGARVTGDGLILAEAATASSPDPAEVVARVAGLVAQLRTPDVVAIGAGIPGRVDAGANKVLSGGYVDLSVIDFAALLAAETGLPVRLDNDASGALLAEARIGAAAGVADALLLTIGTGIGGAVLNAGQIVRGTASAGQLGHVTVDPAGPVCNCGRRGCVESFSSGTALRGLMAAAGYGREVSASDVLSLAQAGETQAAGLLATWAGPLRQAIDTLAAAFAPRRVVLGGGLGAVAAAALKDHPGGSDWFSTEIVAATLGDKAGVIGAALYALSGLEGRRLVMVNGVPASGKSAVAAELHRLTGWPVMALDTVKTPFLEEIPDVDRPFNRVLGRASYKAIFALIGEMAPGSTIIVDAWFGFQPRELFDALVEKAGVTAIREIWCTAPADTIAGRYRARAVTRLPGHPGADYADELKLLAERAQPFSAGPVLRVDTTAPPDGPALRTFVEGAW